MTTLKRPTKAKVLKAAVWTVVIAVAVVVLFTTVFPWVEERQQNPTMGAATTDAVTASAAILDAVTASAATMGAATPGAIADDVTPAAPARQLTRSPR